MMVFTIEDMPPRGTGHESNIYVVVLCSIYCWLVSTPITLTLLLHRSCCNAGVDVQYYTDINAC